jgi:ADP-ribose pyrophosphatase YjhB (NUDIX family)
VPVFLDAAESSGRPAVPPPRMRRMVFVALLSSDGRLALVADDLPGAGPRWVLPSGSVRAAELYREAAVRVLRDAVGTMQVREGAVEGCR